MEKLICKSLLWKFGLTDGTDYSKTLDEMFLADVNNDLLLELESCSSYDYDTAFDILLDLFSNFELFESNRTV